MFNTIWLCSDGSRGEDRAALTDATELARRFASTTRLPAVIRPNAGVVIAETEAGRVST